MLPRSNSVLTQSNLSLNEISEFDELEARSLISAELKGPDEKLQSRATVFRRRQMKIILLLSLCAVLTLFKESLVSEIIVKHEETVEEKIPMEEIRSVVLEAKREFDLLLKEDYGDYSEKIFEKTSALSYFKYPSGKSLERLRRRIKIKLIESQMIQKSNTTFIWAVGGHSAAAAHGNLFQNAYANVIEESLKPIFGSLGIHFYGKNYAMGGTKSGPEVAFCMESIFGRDVDIISWDYGMLDGRSPELYNLWSQRANLLPSRPILFSFGQRYADEIHRDLELVGGTGFERNFGDVRKIFPDSDRSETDVDTLPRGVKNYLCNNGHVEAGEPCGTNPVKFNTSGVCKFVGYQTSWHPGWKEHLLVGRLSAFFILENLLQAIDELGAQHISFDRDTDATDSIPSISMKYLNYLLLQEKEDATLFQQSDLPDKLYSTEIELPQELKDGNFSLLHRSKSICRTALLPNQSRYDGVVTRSGVVADYMFGGKYRYSDEGFNFSQLPGPQSGNSSEIMLVYNHKNNRKICDHAEIDFKDFFYVRSSDNWTSTTFPHDAELGYFHREKQLHGVIILCTLIFDWRKFPNDYVRLPEMVTEDPDFGLYINGVKVTHVFHIADERCYILKHKDGVEGYYFPNNPSQPEQYDIKLRVPRQNANIYLTSMIVF